MTKQEAIHTPDQQAAKVAMRRAILAAYDAAERVPGGRAVLAEMLCATLDTVAAGGPVSDGWSDLRDDADFWADIATPREVEAYTAAGLRRIQRTTFAERARKRVFWMLWENMKRDDRAAFLQRVKAGRAPP